MINIKFINATSVQLVDQAGNTVSNVGEVNSPTEFYYSGDTFSKGAAQFYKFAIEGTNVQLSGTIGTVTEAYQYYNLFKGQTAITNATNLTLSSTGTKKFCYSNMFLDCTNLVSPPTISATTLDEWCFQGMFAGCSSLTSAPALIATTMAPYCYFAMFYGCSSLTNGPLLPATQLANWCYGSMFFNCQNLTTISANFIGWNASGNSTTHWVTNVDSFGYFYNQNVIELYGDDTIPQNYIPVVDTNTPLTFKSTGATTVAFNYNAKYSKNDESWQNYSSNTAISLSDGEKVAFSADFGQSKYLAPFFNSTGEGKLKVYGNTHSIINTEPSTGIAFPCFSNCPNLVDATLLSLPLSSVGEYQYDSMFKDCAQLTAGPAILPAKRLGRFAYNRMFSGCVSLIKSPIIAATTLGDSSLAYMFADCTSLSSIKVNFTDWHQNSTGGNILPNGTQYWVVGVNSSNGVFTKPTALSTILNGVGLGINDSYIPRYWEIKNK